MKRLLTFGVILLFVTLLFTALLFSLGLVKQYSRPGAIIIPKFQKEIIKNETRGMNRNQIIDYSVKLTARTLKFSSKCEKVTFKKESNAHCVLYAKTLASICNYSFQINNINAEATPVVGYPTTFGVNICKLLSTCLSFNTKYKNFTKDHDFVEIISDSRIDYVDACAYDLLGMDLHSVIYK